MKQPSRDNGFRTAFERPYVISWNLTYRCNLSCEHCYLDAGHASKLQGNGFADRSELDTGQCRAVIDDIVSFAPECMTILTGGEPLLRRDILEIIAYAHRKRLWVVVGTNGVLITENLARRLMGAGLRGMALSLDGLSPKDHDRFRAVRGAWTNTVEGAKILGKIELPFIIQTTVTADNVSDLEMIADFAFEELGAKVWNLYFLTPTGRGRFVSDFAPEQYDQVLIELARIQRKYASKMMVNAKCAPHFIKTLFEQDPNGASIKTYGGGAGGCPAGTHYMGIRPNGDVTPCPYLPVFGGNLKTNRLREIWDNSEPFVKIRRRKNLGDRCGECEFNAWCGGCRARAYGVAGDYMAEDPLCTHTPGRFPAAEKLLRPAAVQYGERPGPTIAWEPDAMQRMDQVPPFVRAMVVKSVESYCARNDISTVTTKELDEIRSKMPASRVFGGKVGGAAE